MSGAEGNFRPILFMNPYEEKEISNNVFERVFKEKDREYFEWHRDKENRKIIVLDAGPNWYFQMDNCLPEELFAGKIITIPCEVFHRIISGQGILKIRLVKDFKE